MLPCGSIRVFRNCLVHQSLAMQMTEPVADESGLTEEVYCPWRPHCIGHCPHPGFTSTGWWIADIWARLAQRQIKRLLGQLVYWCTHACPDFRRPHMVTG